VGATGWMFAKCPEGYAEFLGLTGYEMTGGECVRLGFATHLVPSKRVEKAMGVIYENAFSFPGEKDAAVDGIRSLIDPLSQNDVDGNPGMDRFVRTYFADKGSVLKILDELEQGGGNRCENVFHLIGERSPTSTVLTLKLLRHNEGRPMKEVFQTDFRALAFILNHPDYVEGVRARLLDKDNSPKWRPATFKEVGPLDLNL
jgi:enoyl-CoA hydratase/carnithine racemase